MTTILKLEPAFAVPINFFFTSDPAIRKGFAYLI